MPKQLHKPGRLTLSLLFLLSFTAVQVAAQTEDEEDEVRFPPGQWSVSCVPHMPAGYETLPVLATSVESGIDGGIAVTNVSVENRSQKAVSAVRLKWFLTDELTHGRILLEGQTSFLKIPGGLPAGEARLMPVTLVSFGRIYRPLVRAGRLDGKFVIQVAVSEARYSDKTVWSLASQGTTKTR